MCPTPRPEDIKDWFQDDTCCRRHPFQPVSCEVVTSRALSGLSTRIEERPAGEQADGRVAGHQICIGTKSPAEHQRSTLSSNTAAALSAMHHSSPNKLLSVTAWVGKARGTASSRSCLSGLSGLAAARTTAQPRFRSGRATALHQQRTKDLSVLRGIRACVTPPFFHNGSLGVTVRRGIGGKQPVAMGIPSPAIGFWANPAVRLFDGPKGNPAVWQQHGVSETTG